MPCSEEIFYDRVPPSPPLRVISFLIHAAFRGDFLKSRASFSPSSRYCIFNSCRVRMRFSCLYAFCFMQELCCPCDVGCLYTFCFMQELSCPCAFGCLYALGGHDRPRFSPPCTGFRGETLVLMGG
jgi:hypothetical protein